MSTRPTNSCSALAGVEDPEAKRKTIGRLFIDVFDAEARRIASDGKGPVEFLAQGTLYPDVIESVSFSGGPSATIKSHHNVGGLPERMRMKLVEPLRELFKDEVRALGRELGLPEAFVGRHPFPGPGLAIRCPGAVTREKLDILRQADAIYLDEIRKAGLYDKIWQAFAVLLPVRTVGVMGDGRTYDSVVRAARGDLGRRHDRRLLSLRHGLPRPRRDPHHQRGQGRQPRRLRRDLEAAGDDRVGMISSPSERILRYPNLSHQLAEIDKKFSDIIRATIGPQRLRLSDRLTVRVLIAKYIFRGYRRIPVGP